MKTHIYLYIGLLLSCAMMAINIPQEATLDKVQLLTREEWTFKRAVFPAHLTRAEREMVERMLMLYKMKFAADGTLHTVLTQEAVDKNISFADLQDAWQFDTRASRIICDAQSTEEETLEIKRLDREHLIFVREFERSDGSKTAIELHYTHE